MNDDVTTWKLIITFCSEFNKFPLLKMNALEKINLINNLENLFSNFNRKTYFHKNEKESKSRSYRNRQKQRVLDLGTCIKDEKDATV